MAAKRRDNRKTHLDAADDARSLLMAAYVLGRRADEQGKRTFVTQVLIKVLQNAAKKWAGDSDRA